MPLEFNIPSMEFLMLFLLYGIMAGLIYAIFSLGLTVVFSVSKIVNFAHGEFYTMGGYIIFTLTRILGLDIYLSLILTVLIAVPVGILIERTLIRPIYTKNIERPDEYGIIITFGLLIFMQNLWLQIFGPLKKRPPPFWGDVISIGPLSVVGDRIFAAAVAGIILLGLLVFFTKTWTGRAMRAAAQNRVGAQIVGISIEHMGAASVAMGIALAACAGALLSYLFVVHPTMGLDPVIKGFVVIVLGGMGSIGGAVLGGLLLGVFESVTSAFLGAQYRTAYGFVLLLLFLIFRPHGLFGEKVRRV